MNSQNYENNNNIMFSIITDTQSFNYINTSRTIILLLYVCMHRMYSLDRVKGKSAACQSEIIC